MNYLQDLWIHTYHKQQTLHDLLYLTVHAYIYSKNLTLHVNALLPLVIPTL